MGFKTWPAWVKGGLIGLIVLLLILLLMIFFAADVQPLTRLVLWILAPLNYLFSKLIIPLSGCDGEGCWGMFYIMVILNGFITFFIIGALIGLIVGKIKSSKKKK